MPHNACRIRNDPKRQQNHYTLSNSKMQKGKQLTTKDSLSKILSKPDNREH